MLDEWFEVSSPLCMTILMDLCTTINTNNLRATPTPEYMRVIRKRILRFLKNALTYNINYKDLGHTNVCHMTTFPMYPLEPPPADDLYQVFRRLFSNTLLINGGYVAHCDASVVSLGFPDPPFVNRRDFDLALLYMVLTGQVKLTKKVCRSYLFKGGFNPLDEVFDLLTFITRSVPTPPGSLPTAQPGWKVLDDTASAFLAAPCANLSKGAILTGLTFCGGYQIGHWTPCKVWSVVELCADRVVQVVATEVSSGVACIVGSVKDMFIINGTDGLVVNLGESHQQVYLWTKTGITRYDSLFEYLHTCGNILRVERIIPHGV